MSQSRQNSCSRKVRHPSHAAALRAMRFNADMNLEVYACGRCGGYHVGHARGPHHTRGVYSGGRRFEELIAAIDAANRS